MMNTGSIAGVCKPGPGEFTALFCFLLWLIPAHAAFSLSLQGVVQTHSGDKISAALITLTAADGLYSETVYSGVDGRFQIESAQQGKLNLRARKAYFADAAVTVASDRNITFTMQALSTDREISDQLTASAHFTGIHFDDPRARNFFQVDCVSCHQLGNSFTRRPKSREQWTSIVRRMLGFWGVREEAWIARYVDALSAAFDGRALVTQQHGIDPPALSARIFEWKLPDGVISHDTEYHMADGKLYTVDQGADRIYITDPVANVTETFTLPINDLPQGGKFFKLYGDARPLGLSVRHGPHSLKEGSDGKFYTTNAIGGQIGEFDPVRRTYVTHDIGGRAMYPHTLRFDGHGQVWFTLSLSNQLGRFNPASGEMTVIDLPGTSIRPMMPTLSPYGVDINPLDGSIWYSRLHANRIGRVDPRSLAVQEFEPPLIGPRRLRFSSDGMLWIPAFGDGSIVRLDPVSMKYTTFKLPTLAPNEVEAPYAVAIHPQTQEVWVTANMSDRVFRFNPQRERFTAYPLPTRGTYLRDLIFLPDGRVCGASSPMPAALAVEGGMQAIVCIEPNDAT